MRAERSEAGQVSGRGYPSPRAAGGTPRGRTPEGRDRSGGPGRPAPGRPPLPADLRRSGQPGDGRRPAAEPARESRRTGSSVTGTRVEPTTGPHVRGALAALGVFLVTLLAAAIDTFLSAGLGLVTLVALTLSAAGAALLTRRRDLLTIAVAPPLVFVVVAAVTVGLSPSSSLSLPSLATLLVRGFPTMGIATGAALAIALFRLVTRR